MTRQLIKEVQLKLIMLIATNINELELKIHGKIEGKEKPKLLELIAF